ncbi:hypothetical protein M378DRAFT_68635 [Amanita muscaria Koide BX008]|uniref:Aprataxin C2HE/C2H2/C2HC zinc finger domain-containing protein n=1 Tax=Amanita muscaria (strain Koide BX008) TaxID=946122 RepID=A0A0C2X5T9_AMAMK|nr:hypothetical protein M378DRAFT_68635 [Amanita muscaria Koide BX008]
MSSLTALRSIALRDPLTIPNSVLYNHSQTSLVVFDAYPKSIFHFLILPRVHEPFTVTDLTDLRSLLRKDIDLAKELIHGLKIAADSLKHDIEEEMVKRYGFKWEIWMGFHGAPSMAHLHLHVLSADLCSEKMKHKKHYNSFHPKHGFFLHIETVLAWLDATPTYRASMININQATYGKILKEPLSCFHCSKQLKDMPTLKGHLQDEWESVMKRERTKLERKKHITTKHEQLVNASSTRHEEEESKSGQQ